MDLKVPFNSGNALGAAAGKPRGGLRPYVLARLKQFIDARLNEPLRVADLARQACLSQFHFARMFKQSTGKSPHAYLRERRLEAARKLLAETDLPIQEVGRRAGFTGQAHFCGAFRRHTGQTPRRFRQASRGGG